MECGLAEWNFRNIWINCEWIWSRNGQNRWIWFRKLTNLRIKSHFTIKFRWFYQIEANLINTLLALVLLSYHITRCRVVIVTLRRNFDKWKYLPMSRHEMATIYTQAHSHKRMLLNSPCVKTHTNHYSVNRCRKMSKYNVNEHTWSSLSAGTEHVERNSSAKFIFGGLGETKWKLCDRIKLFLAFLSLPRVWTIKMCPIKTTISTQSSTSGAKVKRFQNGYVYERSKCNYKWQRYRISIKFSKRNNKMEIDDYEQATAKYLRKCLTRMESKWINEKEEEEKHEMKMSKVEEVGIRGIERKTTKSQRKVSKRSKSRKKAEQKRRAAMLSIYRGKRSGRKTWNRRARALSLRTQREPERNEQRRSKYFVPFYQRQWNVMRSVCVRPSACIRIVCCLYRCPARLVCVFERAFNVSARCFMNNIDARLRFLWFSFARQFLRPCYSHCCWYFILYSCVALMSLVLIVVCWS